jgi:hypothetical protein
MKRLSFAQGLSDSAAEQHQGRTAEVSEKQANQ